jgi:hypothetical protein
MLSGFFGAARQTVWQRRASRLIALACTCILSACAGEGPPPIPANSSLESIQQGIFNVNCLLAGCHNATDRSGNMVLVEGQSYSNLVNVTPSNDAARLAGFFRVVPQDPARSFLLIKLTGGANLDARYGSPMPKIGGPLSSADINRIRNWIVAGAPPANTPPATAPESTPTATASPSPTVIVPLLPLPTAIPNGTGARMHQL